MDELIFYSQYIAILSSLSAFDEISYYTESYIYSFVMCDR